MTDPFTADPDALVRLDVNGRSETVAVENGRTLVDCLREDLRLTGTKKVCEMGNCGACTVLLDDQAV